MLLDRVHEAIARHRMVERGDRIVVAVSGGVDSVVLLHALYALRSDLGVDLAIAHLDHALRPTSRTDADWVAAQASALGVPCVVERIDVSARARAERRGVEETARDVRREFLTRTADRVGASRIALGHTLDDQAETVLFRLARGTGWDGLRGMAPVDERRIRPLLGIARREIVDYARASRLTWREDESNESLHFARNRIRHHVLPELEATHHGAARAIARTAELAEDMHDVATYVVATLWRDVRIDEGSGRVRLDRARLAALPPGVRSLLLREGARRVRGDLRGLERGHIAAMCRLLDAGTTGAGFQAPRLNVIVTRSEVDLRKPEAAAPRPWSVALPLGTTRVSEAGLVLDVGVVERQDLVPAEPVGDRWTEFADAERVVFPLVVRAWRSGDTFVPLGMPCPVRVSSFLAGARVRRSDRASVAVVADTERILWVVGHRLSGEARMTESTRKVLTMKAREISTEGVA